MGKWPWMDWTGEGEGTSLRHLGRILSPHPSPVGPAQASQSCISNFTGADPNSHMG